MRFARFQSGSTEGLAIQDPRTGLWHGTSADAPAYPGTLDALIARGTDALRQAGAELLRAKEVDLSRQRVLPPIANPQKVICVGLNYRDHSSESGFQQPDYPTLFGRFNTSLIGHGEPILHPALSDTLDFEGELVAVIGLGGRRIRAEDALAHVVGYSVFNDSSIREYQFKTPQWTVGKNFDGTGAFGPWLVTADELPAGARGLRLQTRLNGEVVQEASTDDMVFDVAALIATISEAITLVPGDIIVTGTPSGVGHAREPKLYMRPGDICEVEIERVGLLRNPIVADRPMARDQDRDASATMGPRT